MVVIPILFTFLIILFGVWILFYLSKKINNSRLGLLFGLIHLFLVAFIGITMLISLQYNKVPILQWSVFEILDFPVFLLLISISLRVPIIDLPVDITIYYLPFLTFAVFGSLQYFLIGTGLSQLIKKLKKNK